MRNSPSWQCGGHSSRLRSQQCCAYNRLGLDESCGNGSAARGLKQRALPTKEITSMMKFLSTALLLSLVATGASATGSSTGFHQIQQFQYMPTGIVHVWFTVGVVTGAPSCA